MATVYLSDEASATYLKYKTWHEEIDRALETIGADPYPPGWDAIPHTTLASDRYDGCIVRDFPPFQYVYQFDAPDEITVLIITLCFPFNLTM